MYNFTKEEVEAAIIKTKSMQSAAKELNVGYDTFKKYAKKFGVFNPNPEGKGIEKSKKYKLAEDVFNKGQQIPSSVLRKWVKKERKWECETCGISTWNKKELPLEIDHIDGDNRNNLRENLNILCPNCHSQTSTWKGRNRNNTQTKVSDQELLNALENNPSIRAALLAVGLQGKGGNYVRAYNLLKENKDE